MKLRLASSLGALSLCLLLPASAQPQYQLPEGAGPYGGLFIGPTFTEKGKMNYFGGLPGGKVDYDAGLATQASIGYAFNRYLAADFEFGFIGAEISSVEGYYSYNTYLDNMPFLVNVSLRYPIPRTIVTPYIGAGAGGTVTIFSTDGFGDYLDYATLYGSDEDVVFAWQAFAGLRFDLNRNMVLGIGYRYFASEDSSFSYPPYYPYYGPNLNLGFEGVRTHSVLLSFEYRF